MKIFVLQGLKIFFFAHKKIKIFRVGGKNRIGRVTPIKQFFLGLVLYPSKGGPVLNMFLRYLRSPGHNRKTRTSSFGGVSSFLWLFTQTHTSSFSGIYKSPHTPLWVFTVNEDYWYVTTQPRTLQYTVSHQTEDVMWLGATNRGHHHQ